jgi:hypothetical protein
MRSLRGASARRRLVAAAAGAAAATAAGGRRSEARLVAAAVRREDGELLPHVGGAAVGAIRIGAPANELLEMRLALHADVLVDGHAKSLVSSSNKGRIRRTCRKGFVGDPWVHT